MGWKKRRKAKLVSAVLILVLLIVSSMSSIMAEELNETGEIPVSQLTDGTETQEQTEDQINGISGVLWLDENNNGIIDEDETPISGYPVYLYNKENLTEEIQKVNSDTEGKYEFSELEPGEYIVGVKAEENETGYLLPETEVTDDTDNKFTVDEELEILDYAYSGTITIAEDTVATDIDCGLLEAAEQTENGENTGANDTVDNNNDSGQETNPADDAEGETSLPEDELETDSGQALDYTVSPADLEVADNSNSISGSVWMDSNGDGAWGASEMPVSDYEVFLYLVADKDNAVATTTTDSNGEYVFDDIAPGEYSVGMPVAETVNGTKYLVPTGGIRNDNKFALDVTYNAYTEGITVTADAQVTDYNAGVRLYYARSTRSSAYNVFSGKGSAVSLITTATTLADAFAICMAYPTSGSFTIRVDLPDPDMAADALGIPAGYDITLTSSVGDNHTIKQTKTLSAVDFTQRHFYINGGSLTLLNITLEGVGNTGGYNGGVEISSSGGELIMDNATITNCYNYNGGGVKTDTNATVTMENGAKIENCSAIEEGGGIYIFSGVIEMKTSAAIENCSANKGGGAYYIHGTLNMNNAAIQECEADSSGFTGGTGGGVAGTLTMTMENKSKITFCAAKTSGGGLHISGDLTMDDSSIENCEATYIAGGGVFISNAALQMKNGAKIVECTTDSDGGGVYCSNASLTMTYSSTIRNCSAAYGGGVRLAETASKLDMASGATINNCIASDEGGGVYSSGGDIAMASGSAIEVCKAANNGGGVYISNYDITMVDSNVVSNVATNGHGGGVFLYGTNANLDAKGGSIASNTAGTDGGGIYTTEYAYIEPLVAGNYSHISTDSAVVFSDNASKFEEEPPYNAEAACPQLEFNGTSQSSSSPITTHILNNNDINYRRNAVEVVYNSNVSTYDSSMTDSTSMAEPYGWHDTVTVKAYANVSFTTPSTAPPNYQFECWTTNPNGSGDKYYPTDTFVISVNTVLYAQWELITPSLTIEKTVTGKYGNMTKSFEVTVTLIDNSGTPISGDYTYTGGTLTFNNNGEAKVSIKHGESITIEGIPLDSDYTVEETDSAVSSYTVTYNGSGSVPPTGTLTGGNVKVGIENNLDILETGIGGLDTRMIIVGLAVLFAFAAAIVIYSSRRRRS
ncbi:MAG: SdrD B-like domain-containing protein [Lachnospiraceae bacterium]